VTPFFFCPLCGDTRFENLFTIDGATLASTVVAFRCRENGHTFFLRVPAPGGNNACPPQPQRKKTRAGLVLVEEPISRLRSVVPPNGRKPPTELMKESVAMVTKCANPACGEPFRYLRGGKLFLVDLPHSSASPANGNALARQGRTAEYFWLCDQCCSKLTVVVDRDGKAGVGRVPRLVDDMQTTPIEEQARHERKGKIQDRRHGVPQNP
jgi:hypothetical protein